MSVFTQVPPGELQTFLDRYPVGELVGFQGIGEGVENTNYFVDTLDGRWVLTLFERLDHEDLPFFLGLMDHLAARGFPSAMPMRANDGRTLLELCGKPAALVRRLVGQSVLFPTIEQCRCVGAALAELHLLGSTFSLSAENARGPAWRCATAHKVLPHVAADARALIESEMETQAKLDLAALPQGVIHADLFRDNVLFVDERLTGVIDFYYACRDALIYDLAVTVNDWSMDAHGEANPARCEALIGAYRARREPDAAERAAWPVVLRAAALRFYLSRLHDRVFPREGGLVHVKDPKAYRDILEHHRGERAAGPAL